MSNLQHQASPNLNDIKLQAEIDKINAERDKAHAEKIKIETEVKNLKLFFLARYEFWSAVTPALLAIGALIFAICGNFFSSQNNQLSADRKNNEYENKVLGDKKDSLSRRNIVLVKTSDSLQHASDSLASAYKVLLELNSTISKDIAELRKSSAQAQSKANIAQQYLIKSQSSLDQKNKDLAFVGRQVAVQRALLDKTSDSLKKPWTDSEKLMKATI